MQNIFQVEFYAKLDDKTSYVDGRFIQGNVINIGDVFALVRKNDEYYKVNLIITDILMYRRQVTSLDVGMTARIFLNGEFIKADSSFEIISNSK